MKKWLVEPDLGSYWAQQVNFAVWCTTTACGVSCDIFNTNFAAPGSSFLPVPRLFAKLFFAKLFQTVSRRLTSGFQRAGNGEAVTAPIVTPTARRIAVTVTPCFL